jgi:hypothetical protein
VLLNYSAPLYIGTLRYCSKLFAIRLICWFPQCCLLGCLAVFLTGFSRIIAISFLIAPSVICGWYVLGMILDYQNRFLIDPEGIIVETPIWSRFIPWSRIRRFAAMRETSDKLVLFYSFGIAKRFLYSEPAITRIEYENLIERIQMEVKPKYSDLKVGGIEDATGGGPF